MSGAASLGADRGYDRWAAQDVGERFFRFSVRCDREANRRIEALARRAGVSPTTFVQRHFETILDEPADATGFSAEAFARKHGLSVPAARLWLAMRDEAGPGEDGRGGEITAAARYFAKAAKVSQSLASDFLAELTGAGLVTVLRHPASSQPGRYRIERTQTHERTLP